MMDEQEKLLNRFYRGETTIEEERQLKSAFRAGQLPEEPILSYQGFPAELPVDFTEKIRLGIRERHAHTSRNHWILVAGIAASLLLIVFLGGWFRPAVNDSLQLSDNLKKERFENALRTIGNALEEQYPPVQKVLYEDNKLIITIE